MRDERVELAVLTAGVHSARQIANERLIVGPAAKLLGEEAGIDAHADRLHSAGENLGDDTLAGPVPERQMGREARPPADLLLPFAMRHEVDVAEDCLSDPGLARVLELLDEHALVGRPIGPWRAQLESERGGLIGQQLEWQGVRAAAIGVRLKHREETRHGDSRLQGQVQGETGVLASAPGTQRREVGGAHALRSLTPACSNVAISE